MARVLLNVPKRVKADTPFEVRILISHPMETGQRRDDRGGVVPRNIISSFTCTMGGELVIEAELFPAIAANPYLSFHASAAKSGDLVLAWRGDGGLAQNETVAITVE